MKRALLLVVVFAVALTGAANASSTSLSGQTTKIERLQPVHHSAVHGLVLLRQLPHGGSLVAVLAFGLQPNTEYGSFYYTDGDCDENPEEVGVFTSNSFGVGFVSAVIDEDVDEVGSVSVRTPDYAVLFACADTSG
jgi:hypothetical protein